MDASTKNWERVAAEVEIGGLIQRFSEAVDFNRIEDFVACFAEDGVFEMLGNSWKGHAALRAGMGAAMENFAKELIWRHYFMPPILEFVSDDAAEGRGYCLLQAFRKEGGLQVPFSVDYKDRYIRTAQGWKLHFRTTGMSF